MKINNGGQWYVVCRRLGDVYKPLADGVVRAGSEESAIMRAVEKDFRSLRRLQLKGRLSAIAAGNSQIEAIQKRDRLADQASRP